ncbi:hypothetical protein NA56DRAFT_585739, partial [Hyaloscypha hepaticicola]
RPWNEISIDFIIGLLLYKNLIEDSDFNIILIIINWYSKMIRYITYNKIINSSEFIKLIWENIFLLFNIPNRIISD